MVSEPEPGIRDSLFVHDGIPFCFFMSPPLGSSKYDYKREYERLRLEVLEHGGEWSDSPDHAEAIILARPSEAVAVAAAELQSQRKVHLSKFVGDCIKRKALCDLAPYEVRVPRPYHFYTEEEDKVVESFVRDAQACNEYGRRPRSFEKDHPLSIHGTLLWQRAEAEGVAKPHPWQSLKDRFLKFIRPKMRAKDRTKLEWFKAKGKDARYGGSLSSSSSEEEGRGEGDYEDKYEGKNEDSRGKGGADDWAEGSGRSRRREDVEDGVHEQPDYGGAGVTRDAETVSEGGRREGGGNEERGEGADTWTQRMVPEKRQKEIQQWIRLIAEKVGVGLAITPVALAEPVAANCQAANVV